LASFTYDSMSNRLKRKTCGFAPWAGGGGVYEEGRQPGNLGTTAAVKPRQLQKQKLPSQPQPPTQKRWEGHHSGRGPTPCRLGISCLLERLHQWIQIPKRLNVARFC